MDDLEQNGGPEGVWRYGFRDLACFNKALLAKQIWRMWTMPDSLVALIIKAKYHSDCSVIEATLLKKPSFA
jgi:hypothetical protein